MATLMLRRFRLAGALLVSMTLVPAVGAQAGAPATPKAPSVSVGIPQVSISSVTFKGGVNPHGLATVYAFQFGTTAGYGAQTSPLSVGNGTTETKVIQTITGLQPGTVYHFRLVATSEAGTTNGVGGVFTTKSIPLTIKIAAEPDPVVFGSPFSVSGVLSGTGAAAHQVVLQASPFPYLRSFKNIGSPATTDAGGNFSFSVTSLLENTQFRVVAAGASTVKSHPVIERVAVRVSLHLRSTGRSGFVRMYGTVAPAEVGVPVGFQLMRSGQGPLSVAGTKTRHATESTSRFSRVVRIRRGGLYRAVVRVDNGKQVSGRSRSLLIR